MSLLELSYIIQEAIDQGYGDWEVVTPSATGGYDFVSDLDVDSREDQEHVILS